MASSPPAQLAPSPHIFFQPPKSPALIATTPAVATSTDYFSGSRKRQRPGSSHLRDTQSSTEASWTETPSWYQCPTPSDGVYGSTFGQSSGLVNERYRLAGGFDTPSLQSSSKLEQLTVHEHEFRRRLRDDDMGAYFHGEHAPISGPLARERNGMPRLSGKHDEDAQRGWTSFAFGLVGKVFCFGSNVVRGFYAGGGKGYDLNHCPSVGTDLLQPGIGRFSTPLPGAWNDGEFLGDFEQDSPSFQQQPSQTGRPANKRRQTEKDAWIVVGTQDPESATLSPKRKTSTNIVPRSNLATRPNASRASSRRSIAPMPPRRTSSYMSVTASPAQQEQQVAVPSTPPRPQLHSRRASVASTRSPQGPPGSGGGTNYLSPEAERFAKRQARQDRVADKAMCNMSRRMEEMIRQAQQALGTKYSVEGDADMDDEGFVDEDW